MAIDNDEKRQQVLAAIEIANNAYANIVEVSEQALSPVQLCIVVLSIQELANAALTLTGISKEQQLRCYLIAADFLANCTGIEQIK